MRYLLLSALALPVLAQATQSVGQTACPTLEQAAFTQTIEDREPGKTVNTLPLSAGQVRFFTRVHDGKNQVLVHQWQYNGDTMAKVSLPVGSRRWRTWSSKNLAKQPRRAGDRWTVTVFSEDGACQLGSWALALNGTAEPKATANQQDSTPTVPLAATRQTVTQLLTLGDTSGASHVIRRALERADEEQQATLLTLETNTRSLAQLNKEIRQGHIGKARQRLNDLLTRITADSPVYEALQNRQQLLSRLPEQQTQQVRDNPAFQAATAP